MTLSEVAQHFQVSKGTVKNYVRAGKPLQELALVERHKTYTWKKKQYRLHELAQLPGAPSAYTIKQRLKAGWAMKEALSTPVQGTTRIVLFGESIPLKEALELFEVNKTTFRLRVKEGMSVEAALLHKCRKRWKGLDDPRYQESEERE